MSDLKLKDLRYLVALADTRHFGRAAEKCHVSQPTLSAQLKKLEEYLGVTLVERQPKRIALTDSGEAIVARARRILQDSDEIVTLARHSRDPLGGKLRIALIPTIGPYLLPHIAPQLRRALPKLKLMLYEYQTGPLLEKLHAGEIDLGILALPVDFDGLESRVLFEEPFNLAVPANHPLAGAKSIKPSDLEDQTLLLLEDGHCLRDQALEICKHVGVRENEDFRATSLETLRQMVAAGLGLTLLPQMAARGPYVQPRGMTIRPFSKPAPLRQIGAVWRKSTTRTAAIDAVCDVIQKEGSI